MECGILVLVCVVLFEGFLYYDIVRYFYWEFFVEFNVLVVMWWFFCYVSFFWCGVLVDVYVVCLWDEIIFWVWIYFWFLCGGVCCGVLLFLILSYVVDSVGGEVLFECVKILVFFLFIVCINLDWYFVYNDKKFVFNSFNLRFDDWICLWVFLILLIWCILWLILLFIII